MSRWESGVWGTAVAAWIGVALPAQAVVEPGPTELDPWIRYHAPFTVTPRLQPFAEIADQLSNRWAFDGYLTAAPGEWVVKIDRRTGAGASLRGGGYPMIPGAGNDLTLADIAGYLNGAPEPDRAAVEAIARDFLHQYRELLGVEVDDLVLTGPSGRLGRTHWGLLFEIYHHGVKIENARVVMRLSAGNLIHFGIENYVRPTTSVVPAIAEDEVHERMFAYVGGRDARDTEVGKPTLSILAEATPSDQAYDGPVGGGIGHRLVWTSWFRRAGVSGTWTVRLDAQTGEVLEFFDNNKYGYIQGGILPETSSDTQLQRPFPYTSLSTGGYADGAGIYNWVGPTTVSIEGRYFNTDDVCGASSLTAGSAPGDINWGASPASDCSTPGFGGAGNTKSSRSSYYHLNAIRDKVSAINPNFWHDTQVTANLNINSTCNANWNGSELNFFRSGGGCGNTGEIAAVFLHEWGHGNDQNDGVSPGNHGEAYGDVTAAAQLHLSCIGKGFRGSPCTGYGNACLTCTGVREIDWDLKADHAPATPAWILSHCGGGGGPCGREVHCAALPTGEAFWDLPVRKLTTAGYDLATAWMIAERLFFSSTSTIVNAHSACGASNNGCAATDWFMAFLDYDDDDGNPSNGTPHAASIFAAFNDHNIACGTAGDPGNQNSSTCPAITQVTGLSATPGHNRVGLTWSPVAGADLYYVYRNDFSCTSGFTRIAEVSGSVTSYTDSDVANGVAYNYRVQAVTATAVNGDSCFGALSACATTTPVAGPNAEYVPGSSAVIADLGDGDGFADNCESVTMDFDVINNGVGSLTNVRVTGITADTSAVDLTSSFPITLGALPGGAVASGSFSFDLGQPGARVTPGQEIIFTIAVTANEMGGSNSDTFSTTAEQSYIPYTTKLWPFETGFDGWVNGGSAGWHLSSARVQTGSGSTKSLHSTPTQATCSNPGSGNGKCDRLVSPELRLTGAGPWTLTVPNWYDTEHFDGQWWDRANVHAINLSTGTETLISPNSGGLYVTTSGTQYAACNDGENGWMGGPEDNWLDASTFNLASAGFGSGSRLQLVIIMATDALVTCEGFYTDNVSLTNVEVVEGDQQLDTCATNIVAGPGVGAASASAVRSYIGE